MAEHRIPASPAGGPEPWCRFKLGMPYAPCKVKVWTWLLFSGSLGAGWTAKMVVFGWIGWELAMCGEVELSETLLGSDVCEIALGF